jgi:hypothetical protein
VGTRGGADSMDSLIVILVLVAIYGLAAIAYRRPAGYERIVWPLMAVVVAAGLGINVWNISSAQTKLALYPYVGDDKIAAAAKAADAVTVSNGPALLITIALPVYLMILLAIPLLTARLRRAKDPTQ